MDKFSINYENLKNKLDQKPVFKLSEIQHKLKKVAYDVVRFIDSDSIDGLWQIKKDENGEYIVAQYEEENNDAMNKNSSSWSVIKDASSQYLNIFYKTTPVIKLQASKLGFNPEDVDLACEYLPKKLSNNQKLISLLFQDLSTEHRNKILSLHPEFAEMAL